MVVARIIDRNAEVSWARQELDRLALEVGQGGADHICAALTQRGFAGAKGNYYDVNNSRVDVVLRSRRGIPISLAVVVMALAQRFGLDTVGVNFPRHFMLMVDGVLVDPFAMKVAAMDELKQWLEQNQIDAEQAFQRATPADIVLRMLNNVRMILQSSGEFVRALELSDYQLMLVPENYGVYVERSDIWMRLGDADMVRQELRKALEFAPSPAIAERIEDRIREVEAPTRPSTDLN